MICETVIRCSVVGEEALQASRELRELRSGPPDQYLQYLLGEKNQKRLIIGVENGVPPEALVVSARWWQLETYLRLLVYIQLRALLGPRWSDSLSKPAVDRADAARALAYMKSADDAHPLAHADVGVLFRLIEDYWDQCQHGIGLPLEVWKGRATEIRPIRHRIAHCRRPHLDDVERVEQLLRDLDAGANRAIRSYVDWREVGVDLNDPIAKDWRHLEHEVARRLVPHGKRSKGIWFSLQASRLPWAPTAERITGTPGYFWVMSVHLDHQRHVYIDDYWADANVQSVLDRAAHIIQPSPYQLNVTLPAVGDPKEISDAIGEFFEAVFSTAQFGESEQVRHPWRRTHPDLDPRVDAEGLLSIVSGLNAESPLTVFDARV